MTPAQKREKDRALFRATVQMASNMVFFELLSRGRCQCGAGRFTDGVMCNVCQAIMLGDAAKQCMRDCEAAYNCDKVKLSGRKKPKLRPARR
jgi:hypothetical protein